jgi:NAD-dependent deacetylase
VADNLTQQIRWLADRLKGAQHVACLTGAGVSAESGVPTFRSGGGLWEGSRVEDVATLEAFNRDSHRVWRFYLERRRGLTGIKPNPGHFALAELEKLCPRFDLITQNVDGLHQLAGSRRVLLLHGDIWMDRCSRCGHEERATSVSEEAPNCGVCAALARPGVVWFGECLPPGALEYAASCAASADVMLVVGTSSVVQPAASLADWAKSAGATVVEINLEPTPRTGLADATLLGKSGEILSQVVTVMREITDRPH